MTDMAAQTGDHQRSITGKVISDKMDKTIIVRIERQLRHPLYKKFVRRSSKLHVHDEHNDCRTGDQVTIEQCRPLAKHKAWRLIQVDKRAAG